MTENVAESTTAEPEPTDKGPTRIQQLVRIAGMAVSVILFVTVWILFITLLPVLNRALLTNALRGAVILIGGFLPAIIFGYFQSRRQILFIEYKQNLRRLGFIEEAQIYRKKFDAIYGNSNMSDRRDIVFETPIIVATILSVIGWVIVFYPPVQETSSLTPNATTLAYGFLGAYVFAIGSLVRQYVTDDLQQRYYASVVYRYLAVFVFAGLITFLFEENISNGQPNGLILSLAFTIGFFPSMGIRLVVRAGTRLINDFTQQKEEGFEGEHPLRLLQGPNAYHEDRLLLEGIENIQNLACADIVDLMLKTRFPVEQLVDWIDQSLLYLHTGVGFLPFFRQKGIRTATDFIDLVDQLEPDKTGLLEAGSPLTQGHINAIAVALRNDPNMFHIRYWRDHQFELLSEDVVLTKEANLKLMRGFPEESITLYDELIRQFPNYYLGHFYRGLAHTAAEKHNRAADDYRTALALGGPKWENAPTARIQLGQALQALGQLQEAANVYREAIALDKSFAEAHMEYALLQLFLKDYDEAIEHFTAVVENKFRMAESSANLGLAEFERWKLVGGTPEEKTQQLQEARKNLETAVKLKPNLLNVYLNLAQVFEELGDKAKAKETYTDLLEQPESDNNVQAAYLARLRRGNLHFADEENQEALVDYQSAVGMSATPISYFNLGQVQARLDQPALALESFRNAVRLDNQYVEAYQRLGEKALQLGRYEEAIEAYNRELKLHQTNGRLAGQMIAHLNLGRTYRQMPAKHQEALAELKKAAELAGNLQDDPIFTAAVYEMGITHYEIEEWAAAAEQFTTATELYAAIGESQQSVESGLYLARALQNQSKTDKAIQALDAAERRLDDEFDPTQPNDVRLRNEITALRQTVAP